MGNHEVYTIEGLYEEALAEHYEDEAQAIARFTALYSRYNKALGHVLPTMSREVVVTRYECWNPKTEEWEDE